MTITKRTMIELLKNGNLDGQKFCSAYIYWGPNSDKEQFAAFIEYIHDDVCLSPYIAHFACLLNMGAPTVEGTEWLAAETPPDVEDQRLRTLANASSETAFRTRHRND